MGKAICQGSIGSDNAKFTSLDAAIAIVLAIATGALDGGFCSCPGA